jgi:hypothetical protein
LGRAPSWPAAVLLTVAGVLTLTLRAVALCVALVADAAERAAGLAAAVDEALTARWGLTPLGSALTVVLDRPAAGGGER